MSSGERFGKLVVVRDFGLQPYQDKQARHSLFRCDCGTEKVMRNTYVRSGFSKGIVKSCGCYLAEATSKRMKETAVRHKYNGSGYDELYTLWHRIKNRCYNKNSRDFEHYGAKGIALHTPWLEDSDIFVQYLLDNLGKRPSKTHSLDRIDSTKNYEPGNLRWASKAVQAQNRVNFRKSKKKIRGVYQRSGRNGQKKFRALIGVDGRVKHLGTFDTHEDAVSARITAEQTLWELNRN